MDLGIHTAVRTERPRQQPHVDQLLDQAHTVLSILKVVRSVVVRNSIEGEALVQHVEMEIRDVAE